MKKTLLHLLLACLAIISTPTAHAELKVAALHPILGDLARQIGGSHVQVIDLLKPGGDIHHFEPSARDLTAASGISLVLASGKGIESYLGKLRDTLGTNVTILEVGRPIPSIKIDPSSDMFLCCPAHAAGGIDPHWWHSAENMRRAARVIADTFSNADPTNSPTYKTNADNAQKHFAELKKWAQQQLSAIPRSDRKLVTAHAAYGYFCKEYGFKSVPVLGLAREEEASAQYLTETIQIIRQHKIRALFPEDQANPKILEEIARETGAKIGSPLIADGTSPKAHTFETMLRHNVQAIVSALK